MPRVIWRCILAQAAVAALLIPLLALGDVSLPGSAGRGAAAAELPMVRQFVRETEWRGPVPLPAGAQWAHCSYSGDPVEGKITNAARLPDGRFALAATFESFELWCEHPEGVGRSITVEDTTYGFMFNPIERRGTARVRMGDWSISGNLNIVLREDEVFGLRVTGGGEQVRLISAFEFSRSTGHELRLEELQIAVGPGIFR